MLGYESYFFVIFIYLFCLFIWVCGTDRKFSLSLSLSLSLSQIMEEFRLPAQVKINPSIKENGEWKFFFLWWTQENDLFLLSVYLSLWLAIYFYLFMAYSDFFSFFSWIIEFFSFIFIFHIFIIIFFTEFSSCFFFFFFYINYIFKNFEIYMYVFVFNLVSPFSKLRCVKKTERGHRKRNLMCTHYYIFIFIIFRNNNISLFFFSIFHYFSLISIYFY